MSQKAQAKLTLSQLSSLLLRAYLTALENLHDKYAVTLKEIEARRDAAAAKLQGFLRELGYE